MCEICDAINEARRRAETVDTVKQVLDLLGDPSIVGELINRYHEINKTDDPQLALDAIAIHLLMTCILEYLETIPGFKGEEMGKRLADAFGNETAFRRLVNTHPGLRTRVSMLAAAAKMKQQRHESN